jgi:hypothetical protein
MSGAAKEYEKVELKRANRRQVEQAMRGGAGDADGEASGCRQM